MAHVFTPGLKVSPRTVLQKDRRLPLKGDVLPQVGQHVGADETIARTELPGKVFPVNIANVLGAGPERLPEYMNKTVGDNVQEDEVIAETPGFMGFFKVDAKSPVDGTIESVSKVTGQVLFQAHPIPVQIDAYIDGTVVEIHEGEGVVVQSPAALVQGIFGLGGETRGDIVIVARERGDELTPAAFKPEHKGKVLICGGYLSRSSLSAAIEVGAAGVVVGGFDYDEIKDLLGYEVGVAITGNEDLGLTLVLTEGFGRIAMAEGTWKLLNALEGRRASINGATQIRAGVIRPEVVVTLDADDSGDEKVATLGGRGIELGDRIRGTRSPFFGRIGQVKDLPSELHTMESETRVRVMTVIWEDGVEAVIPRSNVELIEEE